MYSPSTGAILGGLAARVPIQVSIPSTYVYMMYHQCARLCDSTPARSTTLLYYEDTICLSNTPERFPQSETTEGNIRTDMICKIRTCLLAVWNTPPIRLRHFFASTWKPRNLLTVTPLEFESWCSHTISFFSHTSRERVESDKFACKQTWSGIIDGGKGRLDPYHEKIKASTETKWKWRTKKKKNLLLACEEGGKR